MARRFVPANGLSVKQQEWLYRRWNSMRSRCLPNCRAAKNYFLRGIRVEWETFDAFVEYVVTHIGLPDLECGIKWTVDRIDNDRGYAPGNIRWATYTQNLRNRRGNVYVDYRGERVLLAELAERVGLSYFLLHDRIFRQGWSVEQSAETPILGKAQRLRAPVWEHEVTYTYKGETKRVREWAAQYGVSHPLLRSRLGEGWDFEAAVSTPCSKANGSRRRAVLHEYQGRPMTIDEIANATGLCDATLRYRIQKMRLTVEEAVARGRLSKDSAIVRELGQR